MTIAGMAAAFTVLFAAPLGSALFALEILHRRGMQYYEALVPAIVGSLFGVRVLPRAHQNRDGAGVADPGDRRDHRVELLWAAGGGVSGAGIAIVFTYLTLGFAARAAAASGRGATDRGRARTRRTRSVVAVRLDVR